MNERRWHLAGAWAFGSVALFLLPLALRSFTAGFVVLVLAVTGAFAGDGVMVSHFLALQGGEKGLGIAVINSAGERMARTARGIGACVQSLRV